MNNLSKGGRVVTMKELRTLHAPDPDKTWYPISHEVVMETVEDSLEEGGFKVDERQLVLLRKSRFIGILKVFKQTKEQTNTVLGITNAYDKSYSQQIFLGTSQVDTPNSNFSRKATSRRHTKFGGENFAEAVGNVIASLDEFKVNEIRKFSTLESIEIPDMEAESIMLRTYEQGLFSSRQLPYIIRQWRTVIQKNAKKLLESFVAVYNQRVMSEPLTAIRQMIQINQWLRKNLNIGSGEDKTIDPSPNVVDV